MNDDLNEGVSLLAMCATQNETDIGNGNRLRLRFGEDIRYVEGLGWHAYNGKLFREDTTERYVRQFAHRTAEQIRFEVGEIIMSEGEQLVLDAGDDAAAELERRGALRKDASADDRRSYARLEAAVADAARIRDGLDKRRDMRTRFAKSSENSAKLENMLKEAAPYRTITVDEMNTDVLALNCRNGTLRFVEIEDEESDPEDPRKRWVARLDPHRREDLISKMAEATVIGDSRNFAPAEAGAFAQDAHFFDNLAHRLAPTFIEFLHRIMPGIELREYLRRWFGYMLTGETGEQVLAFFYGIGANGKSTLTEVVAKILANYAVTMGIESFTGDARRGGADATPDLARLNAAYGCFASEGDEGARIKEGLVKLLTGDDKIPVRKLHQDFIEIAIKAKFTIVGNHKPIIRGDEDGIWRRVHMVEFGVQIPREERDKHLPEKLLAERDGILAWMISGALTYKSMGGLHPPESLLAAVQEHREESDPVSAYIRNGCEVTGDDADRCSPGELHEGYILYCRREGLTPFGAGTFNRRMPDKAKMAWKSPDGRMRQFTRMKSGGTVYAGIRIRSEFRGGAGTMPDHDGRPFSPRD